MRKTRRIKGGDNTNRRIRFSNNTKKVNKVNTSNNYSRLSNTYLEDLQNRISEPNPIHEENAHLFAKVVSKRNSPEKMMKDLYYLYYPKELSIGDYTRMIELVGNSGASESQKERILQHLRYERAVAKIKKSYTND